MLNLTEIDNLKRLLADKDTTNIELGLLSLAQNLTQVEEFMPILYSQLLLNAYSKPSIENFFNQHQLIDLAQKYKSYFKLFQWVKNGYIDLNKLQITKSKQVFDAALSYFIEYWERIKIVFIANPQLLSLLADIGYYFFYEKNYYLLATEIAWINYKYNYSHLTVETLIQWLAHYHFPHNNLTYLFEKMNADCIQYKKDANLSNAEQFRFIWLQGLMYQGLNNMPQAVKTWQDGLKLVEKFADIADEADDLISNIYFHLSMHAINENNFTLAKQYSPNIDKGTDCTEYSEAQALILSYENKDKQAYQILWDSIKERPTDESYYKTLVKIYQKTNQIELIIDTWILCIEHSPEYGLAMRELVNLLPQSTRNNAQDLLIIYQQLLTNWEKAVLELKAKLI